MPIPFGTVLPLLAFALAWPPCGQADDPQPPRADPSYLTVYDLATPDDLRLTRMLRPGVVGESVAEWPILKDVTAQLGDWVSKYFEATQIAGLITNAMPVDGQPPLRRVDELVAECARTLHVEKPTVFVRNSATSQAYVTKAADQPFLVLTSGLLDLYEGRPEELKFVIGHELGHLKCDHLALKEAAFGIYGAVKRINVEVVPDQYQAVLPTLALGRLFSWARESEIGADRAGLLCCKDPQVAFDALHRLLSGLKANSTWVDPSAPHFDADALVDQFERWEDKPFVEFIVHARRFASEAPFIPERVAALKQWAASDQYRAILARAEADRAAADQLVVIKTIKVNGLADQGKTVHPYLLCYDGDAKLFQTTTLGATRAGTWSEIDVAHGCADGQPLFFEIWDDGYLYDGLVGAFVIYPINPARDQARGKTTYTTRLLWDWEERTGVKRTGLAQVELEFRQRAKE